MPSQSIYLPDQLKHQDDPHKDHKTWMRHDVIHVQIAHYTHDYSDTLKYINQNLHLCYFINSYSRLCLSQGRPPLVLSIVASHQQMATKLLLRTYWRKTIGPNYLQSSVHMCMHCVTCVQWNSTLSNKGHNIL